MEFNIFSIMSLFVFPVIVSIHAFSYIIESKDEYGSDIEIIKDYKKSNIPNIVMSTILLTLVNYTFIESIAEYKALVMVLYLISIYDLRFKLVPDRAIVLILIIGIIYNISYFSISGLVESIITCLLVFTVFMLLSIVTKGGIGGADIKLFSLLGLMFSYQEVILIIFLTYLIGCIFVAVGYLITKNKEIALIPYISLAIYVTILYSYEILYWYNYGGFSDFMVSIIGGI